MKCCPVICAQVGFRAAPDPGAGARAVVGQIGAVLAQCILRQRVAMTTSDALDPDIHPVPEQ